MSAFLIFKTCLRNVYEYDIMPSKYIFIVFRGAIIMIFGYIQNLFLKTEDFCYKLSKIFAPKYSDTTLKEDPEKALEALIEGNKRFYTGKAVHPRVCLNRLKQAGKEDQSKHAFATILSCADSRVPVERIFDTGVMDIFVVRVAGNVCDGVVTASLEYGITAVKTPILVFLGHTQCGAVTEAVNAILDGYADKGISPNIKNMLKLVEPAVNRMKNEAISKEELIEKVIEENIFESLHNFIKNSPHSKKRIQEGKVKVVGAIYDISTGAVSMLPCSIIDDFLNEVI